MSRFPPALAWSGAVVALLVGLYAGPAMPWASAPNEGSVEVGFSRDMQTHHGQAVAMSALAFDRSRSPEVRALALDVVTTQSHQIGTMAGWLEQWDVAPRGNAPAMAWMDGDSAMAMGAGGLMPGMATQPQLDALAAARGVEFDRRWAELLREHHAGGLSMLHAVLRDSDRPVVRDLAASMLASQQVEIEILDDLRQRLG